MLAWAIGCSLAALAGILTAPLLTLSHTVLTLLIINAYAAAMIGRLRSLPLTFVGAIILGLADAYATGYIPTDNEYFSQFRVAVPVIILFIVLLVLKRLRAQDPRHVAHPGGDPPADLPRHAHRRGGRGRRHGHDRACGQRRRCADAREVVRPALVAVSLVPLAGFAGQISLCQLELRRHRCAGHGVPRHGGKRSGSFRRGLAGAVGALVALPALRLSGIYLALATAAFAVILDRWLFLSRLRHRSVEGQMFGSSNLSVLERAPPGLDTNQPKTLARSCCRWCSACSGWPWWPSAAADSASGCWP